MLKMNDATLRAFLDGALSPTQMATVEAALAEDPQLQARLDDLRQEREAAAALLAPLAPDTHHLSPTSAALKRFKSTVSGKSANPIDNVTERMNSMKQFVKQYQPAIIGLAAALVMVLMFSFVPVRALAGQFLQIFRVQGVVVVPVDTANLEGLEGNENLEVLLEQIAKEAEVLGEGEEQTFDSVSDAATAVPFTVAELGGMPVADGVMVSSEMTARVLVDRELAQAVLDAADVELQLPRSLDDTPIIINRPTMLGQAWGFDPGEMKADRPDDGYHGRDHASAEARDGLLFLQMPAPEIQYPDDLDLNALGVAGLQMLGYSEAEAIALGATIDWANTLVLPIPTDTNVDVTQVDINGATGQLVNERDGEGAALTWQSGGMTYFLTGSSEYNADTLLELARSVR